VCLLPSFCSCGLLLFGVYWLLIFPQMVAFHCRAVLRAFLYISSACICSSFCCTTPPLPLPMGPSAILDNRFPIGFVHVCIITRSPPFLLWTGHSSLLSLVIYFVVEIALLLPTTIIFNCHYLLSSCLLFPRELQPMYFCVPLNNSRWCKPRQMCAHLPPSSSTQSTGGFVDR